MNKKQNKRFNFILIISVLFFGVVEGAQTPSEKELLVQADSLFDLQKYTESFEVYEQILEVNKTASSQMLVKMAFIKEGLGDYSNALFFLNKYFHQTADKKAQNKMKELADEHELEGFSLTDYKLFKGIFNKHYAKINVIVFSIALFLVGVVVYRKFKSKSNAVPYAVSSTLLLLVFFWVINFQLHADQIIIMDDHAYLMTGPSAGADLVDVVKKGHRLDMLAEEGIWTKVDWLGEEAFVRTSKVKLLN